MSQGLHDENAEVIDNALRDMQESGQDFFGWQENQSAEDASTSNPASPEALDLEDNSSEDEDEIIGDEEIGNSDDLSSSEVDDAETNLADSNTTLDIEEVSVKADGRRKTIKVDYANRDAIKRAYLKAAGMDKFRKERDSLKKEFEEFKVSSTEDVDTLAKFNKAYEGNGLKGLAELLGANEELDALIEERASEREYLANLTAEERAKLELKKTNESWEQKFQAEKAEREKLTQMQTEREEKVQQEVLQSLVTPSFERYRTQGKLGNASLENSLDNAIFTSARERLASLPDNVELSRAVVDKVFRTVAAEHSKGFNDHIKKNTKQIMDKKKQQAGKAIRNQAKRGQGAKTKQQQAMELAASGDLSAAWNALKA